MKEFYGGVSFVGRANFTVRGAENIEKAKEIVFEDIEGMQLFLKDGTKVEITEINWDLFEECGRGNVTPSNLEDFYIEEERE